MFLKWSGISCKPIVNAELLSDWLLKKCVCVLADIQRSQGPGVHVPHSVLCVHRRGAVGGLDHLQDPPKLHCPPGHEVSNFMGFMSKVLHLIGTGCKEFVGKYQR